jgi:hypothetical protein
MLSLTYCLRAVVVVVVAGVVLFILFMVSTLAVTTSLTGEENLQYHYYPQNICSPFSANKKKIHFYIKLERRTLMS